MMKETDSKPHADPAFVVLGETLCRIRFWTQAEWDALDPARRPAEAVHKPGFGWAAPVASSGVPGPGRPRIAVDPQVD